jgi:hypothetical protein
MGTVPYREDLHSDEAAKETSTVPMSGMPGARSVASGE